MAKKVSADQSAPEDPFPALLSTAQIQERLNLIFPEAFADRALLVGDMAARVMFVFLYGGFIEGSDRYLRPSHVYLFTGEQGTKTDDADRSEWIAASRRPGFRPAGKRWYADTSRESIRDDLIRNRLLQMGIVQKLAGVPTTSSKPIYYLSKAFAALIAPSITGADLLAQASAWRTKHLNAATLGRMALRAGRVEAHETDVLIEMPDRTRIRIAAGPSAQIVKGLIEEFAPRHIAAPAVLWISGSETKQHPEFSARAERLGLRFDLNAELPDLILVDLSEPPWFYLCEAVASDGAVTTARASALLALIDKSALPASSVRFLSAFEDRSDPAFRKNFSQLAVDSLVWFRTEPALLVVLTTNGLVSVK